MARGRKMIVLKKRGPEEWLEGDNLAILRGIALQCLTYKDIAACIGIVPATLDGWRKKYPGIAEAIELGREEANAVIITTTFEMAASGIESAMERWWKYRIKPVSVDEDGEADGPVQIFDDIVKAKRNGSP